MARTREEPNKFQQYCIENNLTAGKVATECGISKSAVYSYYSGERLPSRKTMKVMEEKLGINAKEMF